MKTMMTSKPANGRINPAPIIRKKTPIAKQIKAKLPKKITRLHPLKE